MKLDIATNSLGSAIILSSHKLSSTLAAAAISGAVQTGFFQKTQELSLRTTLLRWMYFVPPILLLIVCDLEHISTWIFPVTSRIKLPNLSPTCSAAIPSCVTDEQAGSIIKELSVPCINWDWWFLINLFFELYTFRFKNVYTVKSADYEPIIQQYACVLLARHFV